MARQLMVVGRLLTIEELVQKVDDVTPESMRAFAEQLASAKNRSVCVIGAGRKSAEFAAMAGHAAPPAAKATKRASSKAKAKAPMAKGA
jgi:hypothetical protein